MSDITEFTELDPESFHLVGSGANGFGPLLAKALDEAEKEAELEEAHKALDDEIGVCFDEEVRKFVSAAERRKLAGTGAAMPDGAFPIVDAGHLRSAIGRLGNYKGNRAAAKRHIIKRAKALGLTHMLPKEWNVTKEASQESEQDFSIPSPESVEGQGEENHPRNGAVHIDVTQEGVTVRTPAFSGSGAPSPDQKGYGSTAPDKSLPKDEALGQTHSLARKEGSGNGMGDPAPGGKEDDEKAQREAETQTDEEARQKEVTKSDKPGSPKWEKHDAALAEAASQLLERGNKLVEELGSREKAEASKAGRRLSTKTEGAIRRVIQACQELLDGPMTKEIEMTSDELIKLLDERDKAARRASKKADQKAAAKKAAKEKAEKRAQKALQDPEWIAKRQAKKAAKVAEKAAKAATKQAKVQKTLQSLTETLDAVKSQVEVIGRQPMPAPVLNAAGIAALGGAAVLRGQKAPEVKDRSGATWSVESIRKELAEQGVI